MAGGYQQEVRLYKTGENLEVNWSVAARLVGGLRGAARRVGLAMTDQELPTARTITDNLERKADRNRRGIEALSVVRTLSGSVVLSSSAHTHALWLKFQSFLSSP